MASITKSCVGLTVSIALGLLASTVSALPATPDQYQVSSLTVDLGPSKGRADANAYAYVIAFDHWSATDERDFSEFISLLGNSHCSTVNDCLHDPANPFRASDPAGVRFRSDCANLPFVLRAYFAWKRKLPFSYESDVEPRGDSSDARYSQFGNLVTHRTDVLSGSTSGYNLLNKLLDATSSATFRVNANKPSAELSSFYSPSITQKSIRPGTVIYDPDGHVAIVFKVEADGRIRYMDAHPDNEITRSVYDLRFTRALPAVGAGFKNWRPLTLVGYRRGADNALVGGHMVLATDGEIPDFSDEQYYGNGARPDATNWESSTFTLNGEVVDYYDYVRAKLSGGTLSIDPLNEVADLVDANCDELRYRVQAVDIAIAAGMARRPEPSRLPQNIYGTEGDWETYSSPSRDARLKTSFKNLRDSVERYFKMWRSGDAHLRYTGADLAFDLAAAYRQRAALCSITYTRSDGSKVQLSYEEARKRLFRMSFDPYQCVELRWGAETPAELQTCYQDPAKRAWYVAEQSLRNQIDRTYDRRMDYSLADLEAPDRNLGVAHAPDVDTLSYLEALPKSGGLGPNGPTAVSVPPTLAVNEPVQVGFVPSATPLSSSPTRVLVKQGPDLADWRNRKTAEFAAWQTANPNTDERLARVVETTRQLLAMRERNRRAVGTAGFARPDSPTATDRMDIAGTEIWEAPEAPKMVVIPAGEYTMGSPASEAGRKVSEGPRHHVSIPYAFAVSETKVTFNEWDACVSDGGCKAYTPNDQHWGRGEQPVINVNWDDANAYVAWLSAKTKAPYRLLSEAEWEYAARAGTDTPYYSGYAVTNAQANFLSVDKMASAEELQIGPTTVRSYPPNPFGLFDMEGNVWEWVSDCWNDNYAAPRLPTQGEAWVSGDCERRVVRAGSFNYGSTYVRSASRFWIVAQVRSAFCGFRVARSLY